MSLISRVALLFALITSSATLAEEKQGVDQGFSLTMIAKVSAIYPYIKPAAEGLKKRYCIEYDVNINEEPPKGKDQPPPPKTIPLVRALPSLISCAIIGILDGVASALTFFYQSELLMAEFYTFKDPNNAADLLQLKFALEDLFPYIP